MDVERVAKELYGLRPSEFVAARDAYVVEARKAKDTAAAKSIAAMRRPALAAWAANLLSRAQQGETAQFLALGETLREAHRTLDAKQLRAASRQQHQLVTVLSRTAAALARGAGQPVSDTVQREIEQILHAVLARTEVAEQWAKGQLVSVPDAAVDFDIITPAAVPTRPAPVDAAPAQKKPKCDEERSRRDLERARTTARETAAEARRSERDLGEAQEAQRAAVESAQQVEQRLRRLEHELEQAQHARSETGQAVAQAGAAVEAAERSLRDARQAADEAVRTVAQLEQQE
ncbi:hypothetical protein [Streptomyces sp. NPDC127084]|uniref:hypothetical protein n=1 Tax=Streptomyces sp. NPDC127084 TaxID=3347133 RepID=UPI00364D6126